MSIHGGSDPQVYRARRKNFYSQVGKKWIRALSDPYDILDPLPLDWSELAKIRSASETVSDIYRRYLLILRNASDELLAAIGIPPDAARLARTVYPPMDFPLLSRIDFAQTTDGFKLLEINAEAPGLLVETFPLNALANAHNGGANPNSSGERVLAAAIKQAVSRALAYLERPCRSATVVVSSFPNFLRDREIAGYILDLMDHAAYRQISYVPIGDLRIDTDGIFDTNGQRIDVVFRAFPFSMMKGNRPLSLNVVASLIRDKKVALVNPPCAIALESKAAQAIIWGLRDNAQLFGDDGRRRIEKYFLPTFLDPPADDGSYVIKPYFGFSGDTIAIVDDNGNTRSSSADTSFVARQMVYQRYVELPTMWMMTERGISHLTLVGSCFLIDGVPCGVIIRAGEGITNFDWWVVPVSVRK